ncbi:hypothetical protein PLEOSDRAFT_1106192 [Pleurotus ostreatus PC15]|uniref:Ribonuclease H1 N-terminal domain-containing protein n=1 Tax=Pleurotus ostreatus (strain PC15) TaxID=1137138 RepID=A0A067NMC8_PLEO1|nr:hypothetical protein PLEOSDRAFT_1106192 [Pleurotus ostreatus PC15]
MVPVAVGQAVGVGSSQATPPIPPNTPMSALAASSSTATPPATPTSSSPGRWYAVTVGRQIGVFQDWYGVVEPLVQGVPGWRCRAFGSYEAAQIHFNAQVLAGATRIHTST